MPIEQDLSVDERIKQEYERLRKEYEDLSPSMLAVLDKTILNTAILEVRIEDLSKNLHEYGYTELFTQSPNTPPYERERVQAKEYKDFIKLNQTNYRVLSDAMNRHLANKDNDDDDGFESFINSKS
ncbi:hypothetical protein [Virgibacillus dokdonensis]|uniref:hypothetical protein n=1 Tax=Virgibacillus dokdonensis TaxID=302167 RepID=UPI00098A58B3|nr:hypothetical protein [Virgibacillus dokdonensis]